MSLTQFIRSHFSCYLLGGRPDYGAAVVQATESLRPQVARLRDLLDAGADPGCAHDPRLLCSLLGYIGHYADRYHLKSEAARFEVTMEVLSPLFGEEAASEMVELLRRHSRDVHAGEWIQNGDTCARAFELSGTTLMAKFIDDRLAALGLPRDLPGF